MSSLSTRPDALLRDRIAALSPARLKGMRRGVEKESLRALPGVTHLDILRGVEGEAARQYFSGLNLLVRPDRRAAFAMDGRTRRPPRDRFNTMLSFLYAMWMNDCRSALEAAGLDPQVGFLHALRPGRAALALDLMEAVSYTHI